MAYGCTVYKAVYIQICDGPHIENPTFEQLIYNARTERFLPGDGDIDIASMLRALPREKVISIEIPRGGWEQKLTAKVRAEQALERTKALIDSL